LLAGRAKPGSAWVVLPMLAGVVPCRRAAAWPAVYPCDTPLVSADAIPIIARAAHHLAFDWMPWSSALTGCSTLPHRLVSGWRCASRDSGHHV